MEIIKITGVKAEFQLSIQELTTFKNALNEVHNTLYVSEFQTRMGVSCEEVRTLSNKVEMKIIKTTSEKADMQTSTSELVTLNNALNEVCNGIKIPEFEAKMGASREEVKGLLKSVGKLLDELSNDTLDVEPS